MPDFQASAATAIRQLHARFPDTPFLTLGQTVLWDEPTKAAFCRLCEEIAPTAEIVAGVHDTDYFAKLPGFHDKSEKFALLPHNDGTTRGLWSAAGEISALFGAEIVPTRHALSENGVAWDRVAKRFAGGNDALLESETAAWGWRALVHTEARPLIAADVKLRDIAPALLEQLRWATTQSLEIVGTKNHENFASQLLNWTIEYSNQNADATLSDLYRFLTPKLWKAVRGEGNCNLQTTTSMQLFRFNSQTCGLPRFAFLELFLQPQTREIARSCYDEAVRGSGIYQLSQFGEGALPFDVVIPNRGRGTLRLHDKSIFIETETPIELCHDCDCQNVAQLAQILEKNFGENVAIVGKAVALISMLAKEFIFVFHEKASSYTSRTQQMNRCLRAKGVDFSLHPMLRIEYATWNSLENVEANFRLPPHLARAFSQENVSAREFASRWESVCDEQDALRAQLKSCASTRDLLRFLASRQPEKWSPSAIEYSIARRNLNDLREQTRQLASEIDALRETTRQITQSAAAFERGKGELWRRAIQPLRARACDIRENAAKRLESTVKLSKDERRVLQETEQAETTEIAALNAQIESEMQARADLEKRVQSLRIEARAAKVRARALTQSRVVIERSDETKTLRATIAQLEWQAETERLHGVRDAILVSQGLRYTNLRPTAWWLPLVSPDGTWFQSLTASAKARIESL